LIGAMKKKRQTTVISEREHLLPAHGATTSYTSPAAPQPARTKLRPRKTFNEAFRVPQSHSNARAAPTGDVEATGAVHGNAHDHHPAPTLTPARDSAPTPAPVVAPAAPTPAPATAHAPPPPPAPTAEVHAEGPSTHSSTTGSHAEGGESSQIHHSEPAPAPPAGHALSAGPTEQGDHPSSTADAKRVEAEQEEEAEPGAPPPPYSALAESSEDADGRH
jgi:hypothetical protein